MKLIKHKILIVLFLIFTFFIGLSAFKTDFTEEFVSYSAIYAQEESPKDFVLDLLKDYIGTTAKPGTKAVGLGSWIKGGDYRNPLTYTSGVPSDHDIRLIMPKGTSDQEAFNAWIKAQQWVKDQVNMKYGHGSEEAQKVLKSINLYPPDQLIENVGDFNEAKKRFDELLKSRPNLNKEEVEGYFGKYNKALRDKKELTQGVLISQDPKTLEVTLENMTKQIAEEGPGIKNVKNLSKGAIDSIIHAEDAIKQKDPKYIKKYLQILDNQLENAKDMAKVKQSNYIKDLIKKLDNIKSKKELTGDVIKEIEQVLQKAKTESKLLTLLSGTSDSKKAELIKGVLADKWQRLLKMGNELDELIPIEKLLSAAFVVLDGYMARDQYLKGDTEGAIRSALTSVLSNYAVGPGILATLTNVIIDDAKENGYTFASGFQDCDGLLNGDCSMLGRGQALDDKDGLTITSYDQIIKDNKPKTDQEFEQVFKPILTNNAQKCASRDLVNSASVFTDKKVAEATVNKCMSYYKNKWNKTRYGHLGDIKLYTEALIEQIRDGKIELPYTPDPVIIKKDEKNVKVTINPDYIGNQETIREILKQTNALIDKSTPGWHLELLPMIKWFIDGKKSEGDYLGYYGGYGDIFNKTKAKKEVTLTKAGSYDAILNFIVKFEFRSKSLDKDPDDPIYREKYEYFHNRIITIQGTTKIDVQEEDIEDKDKDKDQDKDQDKDKTQPEDKTKQTDKTHDKDKTSTPQVPVNNQTGNNGSELPPNQPPIYPPVIPPILPPNIPIDQPPTVQPDQPPTVPPEQPPTIPPDTSSSNTTDQSGNKTVTGTDDKKDQTTTKSKDKNLSIRDQIEAAYKAKDWEKLYKLYDIAKLKEDIELIKEYQKNLANEFAQEHKRLLAAMKEQKTRIDNEYNSFLAKAEPELKILADEKDKIDKDNFAARRKRDYETSDALDAKYKKAVIAWAAMQKCISQMKDLYEKKVDRLNSNIYYKEDLLNNKLNDFDMNGLIRRYFFWEHKSQAGYINDDYFKEIAGISFSCKYEAPKDEPEKEAEQKATISVQASKNSVKTGETSNVTVSISTEKSSYSCSEGLIYDWSGQNIGSGGSMNKQSSVTFISSKPGSYTIGATAKCGGKTLGSGSTTITVTGTELNGKILGLSNQVYYASTHSIGARIEESDSGAASTKEPEVSDACRQQREEMARATKEYEDCLKESSTETECSRLYPVVPSEDFCGPFMQSSPPGVSYKILWNSSPNLKFDPQESSDTQTRVTFNRMNNPTRIWAEVTKSYADGQTLRLDGEIGELDPYEPGEGGTSTLPSVEVEVISPEFTFKYEPSADEAKVGQPVKVSIIADPDVDKSLIDYRWIEPTDRKELETGVIEIVPKDTKPIKLEVIARVPHYGDVINDQIKDEFTPGALKVTAKVIKAKYDIGSKEWKSGQGHVDVKKSFVTDQDILLGAEVDGIEKEKVNFEWSVKDDTCHIIAGQYSNEVTMNKSTPGTCEATVIAYDKEKRKLGEASVSFDVSEQDTDDGAQKIIEKAQQEIFAGKLDEGIQTLTDGLSKYPKSKAIQDEQTKFKAEKEQVLKHLENIKSMLGQDKIKEAEAELAEAQKLHPKYQPVIDAEKQIKDAKIKLAAKKLEEAKKIVPEGKLDEGITLLDEATVLDPNNAEVKSYQSKLKSEKETVNKHLAIFNDYILKDKCAEAEAELKVPNELHPKYKPVVDANELLKSKKGGKNKELAAKLFEEAKALAGQDKLDEALAKAEEAKTLDPENKEIPAFIQKISSEKAICLQQVEKTKQLVQQKKFEEASKELEVATKLHAQYQPVKDAKAYLDAEKKKYEQELQAKIKEAQKTYNEKKFQLVLTQIQDIRKKYVLDKDSEKTLAELELNAKNGIKNKALALQALKEGEELFNQYNYSGAVSKFNTGLVTYKDVWAETDPEVTKYGELSAHASLILKTMGEIEPVIKNDNASNADNQNALTKTNSVLTVHQSYPVALSYKQILEGRLKNKATNNQTTTQPQTVIQNNPNISVTEDNSTRYNQAPTLPNLPMSTPNAAFSNNPNNALSGYANYSNQQPNYYQQNAQQGNQTSNQLWQEYMKTVNPNNSQIKSNQSQKLSQANQSNQSLDNLIKSTRTFNESQDKNRGVNSNNNVNPIYTQPQIQSTNPSGGVDVMTRIQNMTRVTSAMEQANQIRKNPSGSNCTGPCVSGTSIPMGNGIPETNRTNGIDDDGDGVIDEGPMGGNFQFAIHDTGGDKDDQWNISIDGRPIGVNNQGKTRFWDLTLSPGNHTVSITGVAIPDNTGTYTIWFGGRTSVIGGPPLTGSNLNQGVTFTWQVRVQ